MHTGIHICTDGRASAPEAIDMSMRHNVAVTTDKQAVTKLDTHLRNQKGDTTLAQTIYKLQTRVQKNALREINDSLVGSGLGAALPGRNYRPSVERCGRPAADDGG